MTMNPPRIFISYARKDAEAFAADLRRKLTDVFGEQQLWRDRDKMEGGVGWWKQITDALESVAFMVLIATPAAMASEVVRKEWRYARQQGVCVYPVQVPGQPIDFSTLPRWMRDSHFYDLTKEWESFIAHLHAECRAARVPFMAQDVPAHFVQRPAEFEAVKARLLDAERQNPVAITTALKGAGGFGKTTLAAALCHDEDVQTAFDDGVLWVTLGEQPDVVGALSKLYRALTGEGGNFVDAEEGAVKLAEKLADKDCLIVIDDVWNSAHLRPFLRGGERCARLMTTRDAGIAVNAKAVTTDVDEMQPNEAVALLRGDLGGLDNAWLRGIAARLGEWPLMLEIANSQMRQRIEVAHDTPEKALLWLEKLLDKRGIRGIQRDDAEARKRDATGVLQGTFDLLTDDERDRLMQLSVFKDDADIPLSSIACLWALDEFDTEDLILKFAKLMLVRFSSSTGTIRIHDVIREVLAARIGDMPALHRTLLSAWGDALTLPDAYAWRHYAYHLMEAGQRDTLRALLLDHRWLQAKLDATNPNALIDDCAYLRDDKPINLIKSALTMSSHVLNDDKTALAHQLVGRLMTWRRDEPDILKLTDAIMENVPGIYPAFPDSDYAVLNQAGGPLIRTLVGHTHWVNHVALTKDGRTAVSASWDNTLRVWDVASGETRHVLTGHTDWVNHVAVSADGRTAVSTSDDNTLIVWDLETGETRYVVRGNEYKLKYVAMTDDGHTAISVLRDKSNHFDDQIILWDVVNRKPRHVLQAHTDVVLCVALTPNGQTAIWGTEDGTLIVWDIESGEVRHILKGHTEPVYQVALTRDGRKAVSTTNDNAIIWNIETGESLQVLKDHTRKVNHIALTMDGLTAISALSDSTLIVWGAETGQSRLTLNGHSDIITHVAITDDGRKAVSASQDNTLIVWDLTVNETHFALRAHMDNVTHIASTENGRTAISASWDKTLIVWDIESGEIRHILRGHTGKVHHVALTADGRTAVSASDDKTLIVWDIESGEARHILKGHTKPVYQVALTSDGRTAVSGSELMPAGFLFLDDDQFGEIIIWDVETGKSRHILREHKESVNHIMLAKDGRTAVSTSRWDKTLIAWDVEYGTQLGRFSNDDSGKEALQREFPEAWAVYQDSLKVRPNNEGWGINRDDTRLTVVDANGVARAAFTGDAYILSPSWGADGRIIVAGDVTGRVLFLRVRGV